MALGITEPKKIHVSSVHSHPSLSRAITRIHRKLVSSRIAAFSRWSVASIAALVAAAQPRVSFVREIGGGVGGDGGGRKVGGWGTELLWFSKLVKYNNRCGTR